MDEKSFGGLWPAKNQKHPRAPKYLGSIVITVDDIIGLANFADERGSAKLNIAAWVNEKKGEKFLSIEAQVAPEDKQPKPAQSNLDEFF